MSEKRYLSTVEAAKYLGVSKNTLRKYVTKGQVPAHRVGERLLKFDTAELDDFVKALTR
ncbi:helix-turn-helix transcriptional regulator [Mycobacterium sp. pW045]|uniref:helix-turn-helix transcriptional regulator n=1 Tax=Mycobacterium sp. pW045 TaxID=3238984 RepID=UPI00351B58BF